MTCNYLTLSFTLPSVFHRKISLFLVGTIKFYHLFQKVFTFYLEKQILVTCYHKILNHQFKNHTFMTAWESGYKLVPLYSAKFYQLRFNFMQSSHNRWIFINTNFREIHMNKFIKSVKFSRLIDFILITISCLKSVCQKLRFKRVYFARCVKTLKTI